MSEDERDNGSHEDREERGGGGRRGPTMGVGEVAKGVGEVAKGVEKLIPEDDPDAAEAREAVGVVEDAADSLSKGIEGLGKLASGVESGKPSNLGEGVGALVEASKYIVPEGEVREAWGGVAEVARGVGRAVEAVGGIVDQLGQLGGGSSNTHCEVTIDGVGDTLHVRSLSFDDGVSELPSCHVTLACELGTFEQDAELFDKDVAVTLDRGDDQRVFRGIVASAHLRAARDEQLLDLEVRPALWLLSQTLDSRVFQHKTVPDLVEELVREYLGSRDRAVRRELAHEGDYVEHEYLVQYRESHFQFIKRLCDEEGIWFYFDHSEGDHEILVLADSNDNRPQITGGDEGRIEYTEHDEASATEEVAFGFSRSERMGPTDAVVSDYDWTNPSLRVRHEATGRGPWRGPALETHDHASGARFHGYDEGGGQYRGNTVAVRGRLAAERHDLVRAQWYCSTSVVGVEPGHVFELFNSQDHDGRYLILRVTVSLQPGREGGGYHAALDLVPIDVPYRPPHPRRPTVFGPETATVTGPPGEEIHVDKHGRVKVQFHWDRRGQRDERSSVWIRVSQFWAGPGWGSMFIPRVGTEVIVDFLGGDPDRPVITGRLYNGSHPVPYALPEHKTRSTIMTNSSPNKSGFNELRFEDKAGSEEVYIHAEKDFNEEVEHCHSTHVKVDQSNTVDHDQTETIGHDQTLHVKNDRTKTVDANETNTIKGNRSTKVGSDGGTDTLWVTKDRVQQIDKDDTLVVVDGDKKTAVKAGKWDIATKGEFKVVQNSINEMCMLDSYYLAMVGRIQLKAGKGVHYDAMPQGQLTIKNEDRLHIQSVGDQLIESTGGRIKIETPKKIALEAHAEILLKCGSSTIKLTPSGIEVAGPTVKIDAKSGTTEIDAASQVKIKC